MAITRELLRTTDWSKTPIGPMETWPRSLHSFVQLIMELPTPAIVFWGPEQTQIYNDGYAVIMGPRHPQYFGATYRECWPDTYPLLIGSMRRVLDHGEVVEITPSTPIMVTRHGFAEEAYFSFTFSPLRDDEGRIAGIYQPVVELTELVLRDRRAETLRLVMTSGDVLAQAGAAFLANPRDVPFAAISVRDPLASTLRLRSCAGFASESECEERLAPVASAVAQVLATNTARELEAEIPASPWPDPVRRVLVLPIRRSPEDAPQGVVVFGVSPAVQLNANYRNFFEAVTRDIATSLASQDARRAADAVTELHGRRMNMLFEHAPVGIAVLRGPSYVFEVANPQYTALLPPRPLLHRPLREALPELEGQGIFELVERVFRTGEPFLGRSIPLVLDHGEGRTEEKVFDFAYQPIPGDDGTTESIMVVAIDVTELSRARSEAESASRAKDEFFAILGHELRNPLAPITTALQLMRLRGDDANQKERTVIEHQVEQITRLVDDLLDVSRITRGKVTLKREPVELSAIVAMGIEMASPLFEQRQHHLQVDIPARGLVVDADASRLAQVVSNLLTNAAKYTEPGGRVQIAVERHASMVTLRVVDSGIGIASSMLPRVFEPFAQEHQALDRAQGGLGLGLTIVSNLVQLHGGTVRAESKGRGEGSTFIIELPLSDREPSEQPGPAPTPAPERPNARPRLRVLVVDDNEDAAELLADALGMLGHDTRVAHDGAEALRSAEEHRPDVALLDIGLPVMNGYELAGRLRGGPNGERLRLVAVTGYGQESDRLRTTAAGFDAHLVKPVQLDVVEALLDGYRDALQAAQARPT